MLLLPSSDCFHTHAKTVDYHYFVMLPLRKLLLLSLALVALTGAFVPSYQGEAVIGRSSINEVISHRSGATTSLGLFFFAKRDPKAAAGGGAPSAANPPSRKTTKAVVAPPKVTKKPPVATNSKKESVSPPSTYTPPKEQKGFVMMFGKPQYDWVNNRQIPLDQKTRRHNWLN
jgi:hypothetical protein